MARTSSKKKTGGSEKQQSEAFDVVDALSERLAQLGSRKWKLKDLETALQKAVGNLPDEAVKAHITANLQECAARLHERLLSLQAAAQPAAKQAAADEPAQKAAKRARRSKQAAVAAVPEVEAEEELPEDELPELPLPSMTTSAGYRSIVAAAVAGQPDARFSESALLLARKLPEEPLVLAHVRRLQELSSSDGDDSAAAAVAVARAALGICSALACEADSPEAALHAFAPAVNQLREAWQRLQQEQQQQGNAEAAVAGGDGVQQVAQLVGRALGSMHAALLQQKAALATSQGGSSSTFWRSGHQPSAGHAAEAACSVSTAVCSLCAELRLHNCSNAAAGLQQRQQIEALAVDSASDLRQLAPYATSGQLAHLAGMSQEEVSGSSDAARRFLVLYGAAAKHDVVGERDYLARLVAARKAATAAGKLGQDALAATIIAEAAALPVSQDFVGWLREQPPSSIVAAALEASQRGLDALSAHLVQECSERALAALHAAMQHGGVAAAPAAGGEGAQAAAGSTEAGGEAAMDDLLFFADKDGDATMFGRNWNVGADSDEEEEEEEDGKGVDLGDLPDDDNRSVDTGDD